jgi:hypothetical protein
MQGIHTFNFSRKFTVIDTRKNHFIWANRHE